MSVVGNVAAGLRFAAAGAFAAMSVYFTLGAYAETVSGHRAGGVAHGRSSPAVSAPASSTSAQAVSGLQQLLQGRPPKSAQLAEIDRLTQELASAAASSSAQPPPAKRFVVDLVVSSKDRSEVYVNGVFFGHGPYVGTITCHPGEAVKIDLIPPSGAPRTHERLCHGGTLRIEE
jgi:hypothetical protein